MEGGRGAGRMIKLSWRSLATVALALATTAVVVVEAPWAHASGPALISISPTSGPVQGGTRVTLRGSGFLGPGNRCAPNAVRVLRSGPTGQLLDPGQRCPSPLGLHDGGHHAPGLRRTGGRRGPQRVWLQLSMVFGRFHVLLRQRRSVPVGDVQPRRERPVRSRSDSAFSGGVPQRLQRRRRARDTHQRADTDRRFAPDIVATGRQHTAQWALQPGQGVGSQGNLALRDRLAQCRRLGPTMDAARCASVVRLGRRCHPREGRDGAGLLGRLERARRRGRRSPSGCRSIWPSTPG